MALARDLRAAAIRPRSQVFAASTARGSGAPAASSTAIAVASAQPVPRGLAPATRAAANTSSAGAALPGGHQHESVVRAVRQVTALHQDAARAPGHQQPRRLEGAGRVDGRPPGERRRFRQVGRHQRRPAQQRQQAPGSPWNRRPPLEAASTGSRTTAPANRSRAASRAPTWASFATIPIFTATAPASPPVVASGGGDGLLQVVKGPWIHGGDAGAGLKRPGGAHQ